MSDMSDVNTADQARAALQTLMNGLGLSQVEAGEMLGVSTDTLDGWRDDSARIPVEKQSEIVAAEASLQRLQTLFRPELLPVVVRRPADLFAGECALQWILRGGIAKVVDRYESTLRYQA
jgi:hypothetical protein